VRDILQAVANGSLSVEDGEKRLNLYAIAELEGLANLDAGRSQRLGRPEIIRCQGKPVEQAVEMAVSLLESEDIVILSSATAEHVSLLEAEFPGVLTEFEEQARIIVAKKPGVAAKTPVGKVSIVTAGTSDIPIATQARVMVESLGASADVYPDVGISGLHRLFPVVKKIIGSDSDVVVVIAGQEGGLAPVLAGLIDIPIVGVPASTGTGLGGEGIGALTTMLQACSMGIAVVNIDNGIAAGIIAASIARRAGRGRPGA
jgi:NCAIR mutase (PurE)-related protein